jgi:nickel-dependent lactate racemase
MEVEIPYKGKKVKVVLPSSTTVASPHPTFSTIDELEIIEREVHRRGLNSFLSRAKKLVIIVNDLKRNTPTEKVLDVIFPLVKDKSSIYLVATGTHSPPSFLDKIFGKYYSCLEGQIKIHNPYEDLKFIGKTFYNNEIWLNSLVCEADSIICINSVEPHYFAGFTGGRKSILPGVSGYKTIEFNHSFTFFRTSSPLTLKSNPVHEDMEDAVRLLGEEKIFSIQLVVDKDLKIHSVHCGNIFTSLTEAIPSVLDIFSVSVESKFDIIVTIPNPPLDHDLFQAHKAIENVKHLLKKGGILIFVAECKEGVGGGKWSAWYKVLNKYKTKKELLSHLTTSYYKLGYHKVLRLINFDKIGELWGVTGLEENVVDKFFVNSFHSVEDAIKMAIDKKGKQAKVLVVKDAGVLIPLLK